MKFLSLFILSLSIVSLVHSEVPYSTLNYRSYPNVYEIFCEPLPVIPCTRKMGRSLAFKTGGPAGSGAAGIGAASAGILYIRDYIPEQY